MVRKPSTHAADYNYLRLPNDLQCIIITGQDSQCDKVGCALTVRAGSLQDPEDKPGLAHFVEHLCFKTAQEPSLDQVVTENNGFCNAETNLESTTFMFQVDPDAFEETLEIFTEMLINPAIDEEWVQAELKSIDAEFQLAKQKDQSRRDQILWSRIEEGHVLNRFSDGCEASLQSETLLQDVLEFHSRYYSSDIMTSAIYTPCFSRKKVEGILNRTLGRIQNKGLKDQSQNVTIPDISNQNNVLCIVPVQDVNSCQLTWFLPPVWQYNQSRPEVIIEGLLGHEGKNSLLSYLRSLSFAQAITVGPLEENVSFMASISVLLKLTQLGMEKIDEVLTIIYSFLEMIREIDDFSPFYQDVQRSGLLEFEYSEVEDVGEYCSKISQALQYLDEDIVLTSGVFDVIDEINHQQVGGLLDYLRLENAHIDLMSKSFLEENMLQEQWFETFYNVKQLPRGIFDKRDIPELGLPIQNKFIPVDLSILYESNEIEKIYETKMIDCWHQTDTSFAAPKASCNLGFLLPGFKETLGSTVTAEIISYILKTEIMQEFGYEAIEAGYQIDIKPQDYGIEIAVHGFSDKLCSLVETIVEFVYSFNPSSRSISLAIQRLSDKYRTSNLNPKNYASQLLYTFLQHNTFMDQQKLEFLNKFQTKDFEYSLQNTKIMLMTLGNISQEEAFGLCEFISGILYAAQAKRLREQSPSTVSLLPAHSVTIRANSLNERNINNCVIMYFQFGQASIEEIACGKILEQMLDECIFSELRIEQQLGYDIECSLEVIRGVVGLIIKVVSPDTNPDEIQQKVLDLIHDQMTQFGRQFGSYRNQVVQQNSERYLTLKEKCSDMWAEVKSQYLMFNRKQQENSYLKNFTFKMLKGWLEQNSFPNKVLVVSVCNSIFQEKNNITELPLSVNPEDLQSDPENVRQHYTCYSLLNILH